MWADGVAQQPSRVAAVDQHTAGVVIADRVRLFAGTPDLVLGSTGAGDDTIGAVANDETSVNAADLVVPDEILLDAGITQEDAMANIAGYTVALPVVLTADLIVMCAIPDLDAASAVRNRAGAIDI